MKTYVIILMAAAATLVGCNQSIESASQDFNTLPTAVQKSFRAEAPNAEIASIDKTSENGVEAYRIEIKQEGGNAKMLIAADGRILNSDLAHKTEGFLNKVDRALTPTGATGTKFSALPEKVQKTVLENAPNAEVADVARKEDNGRVIYEVSFKDEGKNPSIRVSEDGTLVQDLQK